MAQQEYRAGLYSPNFPFTTDRFGRSVILGQIDQASVRSTSQNAQDASATTQVPQIYYCHNMMPSEYGVQSVSYSQHTAAFPSATTFRQVLQLRDGQDNRAYLGITSTDQVYICQPDFSTWQLLATVTGAGSSLVTAAFVKGVTYIYFANYGCYKYDFGGNTLQNVSLNGLDTSQVIGIFAMTGYLLAWTVDELAWSTPGDPTEFDPTVAGAGGGALEGARGAIVVCAVSTSGFIAYTTGNAVAATYSGNEDYPFNFRELAQSGGLKDVAHVDYISQTGGQYAYTTQGMQLISVQNAQLTFPELTDFLAGRRFQDFDSSTNTFSTVELTTSMRKSVRIIGSRHLVVSYGLPSSPHYTHAIVYDGMLKRYGKLKIPHVQAIDLFLGEDSFDVPRKAIGLLQADGTILVANLDMYADAADAVIILGKYQLIRQRYLQLEGVEFEGIEQDDTFSVQDMYSWDGANTVISAPLSSVTTNGFLRRFLCSIAAVNHSLLVKGSFALNTVLLKFHVNGRR